MWTIIGIAALIYAISAIMNFSPTLRNSSWFYPMSITLSLATTLLWAYLARILDDKDKIFIATIFWDIAVHGTFLIIPIVMFNVKLNPMAWLGILLVIVGFVLIKTYSNS